MTLYQKLILAILSFYAVDVKRIHRATSTVLVTPAVGVELLYEEKKKRDTERKKERKQTRPYPKGKRRKKKQFAERKWSYQSSQPRDVRFSNQQKLRRMFRNC